MRYIFTEDDKSAILQHEYKCKYICYIKDRNKHILQRYDDLAISDISIDSSSGIRRTCNCEFYNIPNIDNFLNLYMQMEFCIKVGIFSFRKRDYMWYPMGSFFINSASSNYDAINNTFSCTLGDRYSKVDGTINGQVGGASTIIISQKDSNNKLVTIQNALRNFIKSEKITNNCIIDDIGEFYGQQDTNPTGYVAYRKNNPDWNKLPYDLEFNAGDTEATIIEKIRDLYPNVEAYFDVYDNFCCNMIPSCNNDPVLLDNDYMQKIVIGDETESITYDISSIKNVTEVFGKLYEVDRTSETCTYSSNVYSLSLTSYSSYTYAIIAFTPKATNSSNPKIKINSLDAIPLYKEYTTTYITSGTIIANEMNVIMIKMLSDGNFAAYYLGQYQPHAICVLTNNKDDKTYTKKYFEDKYNCKHVTLRVEEDSPFAVQKIGEVLDVKSGDEYESILSDSVASQNAIYQNKISTSRNDTVTLSTVLIPWLDVNVKVSYKRSNSDTIEQYIITSISHNLESTTSTLTLQKFYPLYYE